MRKKSLKTNDILAALGSLHRDDLLTIRQAIDDLLENYDAINEAARSSGGGKSVTIRTARGSVELKYIRGYGPYGYLRWWDGKVHKSKYLGKWEGS